MKSREGDSRRRNRPALFQVAVQAADFHLRVRPHASRRSQGRGRRRGQYAFTPPRTKERCLTLRGLSRDEQQRSASQTSGKHRRNARYDLAPL